MVVESERRRRRRRRQKGRKGDSDSSGDNDKKLLILLQARQTDDISSGEDALLYTGRPRPLNTSSYYILDLHNGTVSTLARTVQDHEGSLSPPVGMGSRIYIFASKLHDDDHHDDRTSVSTYFLDLTNPPPQPSSSSCWKKCAYPPLTKDQLRLDASVAFRGKFYFFRGSYSSCLCEVFDPDQYDDDNNSSSCWHRIKSPPGEHLELTPPVLPDYKNNRIIVCFTNISAMYAYYPSQDRWECLVEKGFHGWFSSLDPVTLVDGVIYIHDPDEINGYFMAYDIATKQWLDVQVSPAFLGNFESYLHLYRYDSLLHLGDAILCLLGWTYEDDNGDESGQSQTTSVHVVQFKVELIKNNNDTKEVLVTPLSSKYYPLNSRCQVLRYLRL